MLNFEPQMNQFKEQMAQAGFSGNAIVDVQPEKGVIRIKVNMIPPENLISFVTNYVQILNFSLRAFNVEARVHFAEQEEK
jgi:hypothetical protein